MQLSKYFTLEDLAPGGGMLSPAVMAKLQTLARLLDAIYDRVGPFSITSAYRSPARQAALKVSNIQAIDHSLHSDGEAADITPSFMTLADFTERVSLDPELKKMIGQWAVKKYTVHLSITTPEFPSFTPMYAADDGKYYRFTPFDLSQYLASGLRPIPSDLTSGTDFVEEKEPVRIAGLSLPVFLLIASASVGLIFFRSKNGHNKV